MSKFAGVATTYVCIESGALLSKLEASMELITYNFTTVSSCACLLALLMHDREERRQAITWNSVEREMVRYRLCTDDGRGRRADGPGPGGGLFSVRDAKKGGTSPTRFLSMRQILEWFTQQFIYLHIAIHAILCLGISTSRRMELFF